MDTRDIEEQIAEYTRAQLGNQDSRLNTDKKKVVTEFMCNLI